MTLDELADLVDDGEGVHVARPLRIAPGEESVAAEHDAVAAGVVGDGAAQHQAEFKAGALPGHPHQRVAECAVELFHLHFAVCRGSQRDAPVGMKVIDVREGKKAVQRRVDGGGDGVVAKGAQRVHRHHVVFGVHPLVAAFERQKLLLVEGGKSGALDAAQVAARALDPQNFDRFAGQRINLSGLGAGIAAGKVGDAQIGAQQVGAVAEQFRLIESVGQVRVPAVFEELEGRGSESNLHHKHHCTGDWRNLIKIAYRKAIENLFPAWNFAIVTTCWAVLRAIYSLPPMQQSEADEPLCGAPPTDEGFAPHHRVIRPGVPVSEQCSYCS